MTTLSVSSEIRHHPAYADWLTYHKANLHIMRHIIDELMMAKAAGCKKTSVKAIINYLRWSDVRTTGRDFKINDRYTGIYTHVIYQNFPELRSLIEKRTFKYVTR